MLPLRKSTHQYSFSSLALRASGPTFGWTLNEISLQYAAAVQLGRLPSRGLRSGWQGRPPSRGDHLFHSAQFPCGRTHFTFRRAIWTFYFVWRTFLPHRADPRINCAPAGADALCHDPCLLTSRRPLPTPSSHEAACFQFHWSAAIMVSTQPQRLHVSGPPNLHSPNSAQLKSTSRESFTGSLHVTLAAPILRKRHISCFRGTRQRFISIRSDLEQVFRTTGDFFAAPGQFFDSIESRRCPYQSFPAPNKHCLQSTNDELLILTTINYVPHINLTHSLSYESKSFLFFLPPPS
ncbi:hypothetical protein DFH07DRAFT_810528 [Mycena maculata]|uniref:Uncharacterized protein n=1 Tax=Mycena maculata TaxID=230809 RepID=A0AAD7JIB0_9AGAR|nr:hypothetical protein DFH07DRAFT_810528 [Mycena maculata]